MLFFRRRFGWRQGALLSVTSVVVVAFQNCAKWTNSSDADNSAATYAVLSDKLGENSLSDLNLANLYPVQISKTEILLLPQGQTSRSYYIVQANGTRLTYSTYALPDGIHIYSLVGGFGPLGNIAVAKSTTATRILIKGEGKLLIANLTTHEWKELIPPVNINQFSILASRSNSALFVAQQLVFSDNTQFEPSPFVDLRLPNYFYKFHFDDLSFEKILTPAPFGVRIGSSSEGDVKYAYLRKNSVPALIAEHYFNATDYPNYSPFEKWISARCLKLDQETNEIIPYFSPLSMSNVDCSFYKESVPAEYDEPQQISYNPQTWLLSGSDSVGKFMFSFSNYDPLATPNDGVYFTDIMEFQSFVQAPKKITMPSHFDSPYQSITQFFAYNEKEIVIGGFNFRGRRYEAGAPEVVLVYDRQNSHWKMIKNDLSQSLLFVFNLDGHLFGCYGTKSLTTSGGPQLVDTSGHVINDRSNGQTRYVIF